MQVPKTPVREDSDLQFSKDNVRFARQVGSMQAVS
jgi:hypothetical protein